MGITENAQWSLGLSAFVTPDRGKTYRFKTGRKRVKSLSLKSKGGSVTHSPSIQRRGRHEVSELPP
jgi:hypothetical protein